MSEISEASTSGEKSQTSDHVTIDIAHGRDEALVFSIKDQMENKSIPVCISKVSKELLEGNNKAYIPDTVSIGPFHHKSTNVVEGMEDQKWRYLYALLYRKPNQLEASLNNCVKAIRELEHRAKRCYSDSEEIFKRLSSDDFVQMLLVDGCFIIELFLKCAFKSLRRRSDPVFSTTGMLIRLRWNMMLLENQIPYFVLQRLFEIVPIPTQCTMSLNELALNFFRNMIPGDDRIISERFSQEGNHLLDLIYHCFIPTFPKVMKSKPSESPKKDLDCATNLQESRIKIRKATYQSLLNVKFVSGVLEIPPLEISKYTEALFWNLIAHEQCHYRSTQHFTSYAFFMRSLIRSQKDVKLLQQQHILLINDDGKEKEKKEKKDEKEKREKEVSELFKKICSVLELEESYYDGLLDQVNGYKKNNWQVCGRR